jgi:serine/threonine protein kinase/Tol biopolymer transport system component
MTPENWQRTKQLFHAALELPPGERSAFLEQACVGDAPMRGHLKSLIEAHEQTGSFIDSPAFEMAAAILEDRPELKAGQQVGRYRVVKRIGSGGMGDVYLARDDRLERQVALKLLPVSFTRDPERLRRFEREARAASALSHPNVCVIHEIGEAEDGQHYIAMEFVEGVTLRQRMVEGLIGIEEALDIGIQVGSALTAAHAAGIVHRDIKPENIILRADGYIKVLDFGVAKLAERGSADLTATTTTMIKTGPGALIGTLCYMSPEQTRGLSVDTRTDIWSLGVVLYEILEGRAPFRGSTPSDLIVEILDREPPQLTLEVEEYQTEFERIVAKALTKERDHRYQTVTDLIVDLKNLKRRLKVDSELGQTLISKSGNGKESGNQPMADTGVPSEGAGSSAQELRRLWRPATVTTAIIVLALAAVAFGLYRFLGARASGQVFRHLEVTKLTNNGNTRSAAISPDGKYVAYSMDEAGKQSLWVRQVAIANNRRLVPLTDAEYYVLNFSPDSAYIFYVAWRHQDVAGVFKIPVLGGSPTMVMDDLKGPGCFSPDGKQVALLSYDADAKASVLTISNVNGTGDKRRLVSHKNPEYLGWPAWSPDGKVIAISLISFDAAGIYGRVMEIKVADGSERFISQQRWQSNDNLAWLSDGSGLLFCAKESDAPYEQIWEISYPEGATRRLTNDLTDHLGVTLTADSKAMVTLQIEARSTIWVSALGDFKRTVQITPGAGTYYDLSWTPDGKILYASDASGSADIWETDADGSGRKQLTAGAGRNYAPAASPDGRRIAFHSNRSGVWQIWIMDRDGGDPRQLSSGDTDSNWPAWSPDGHWLVYEHKTASLTTSIWRTPAEGGSPVRLAEAAMRPTISPDGKLIASWQETGEPNVHLVVAIIAVEDGRTVQSFEVPRTARRGWDWPVKWMPDGTGVVYIDQRGGISNLWMQPLHGGQPKQLTDFKDNQLFSFAWSRGLRLATARGLKTGDAILIRDVR